ncbi:hypothetical protein [Oceanimonas smirnovii]|uniref:hypothetical protein n=1 Tax=Oceanimonas smirnovii TaxID=264574 RepID=UPI00376F86B5
MMILTTIAERVSDSQARVFWHVGTKKKGIIDVIMDFASEDTALVGELAVIRHLLFECEVFGRVPSAGIGYKLIVSKGAIKKLALGKSDKRYAKKFSTFLEGRMKDVKIEVSQNREIMPLLEYCHPKHLKIYKQDTIPTYNEVNTPALGKVIITHHAVEKYKERLTSGDPKKPWASLASRLQHPELQLQPLSDKVIQHKKIKYGRADNIEVWSHPSSSFHYLCIREGDIRSLVTVFSRNKNLT